MPNQPQEVATRYIQHICERNVKAIVALFADNATCIMPDGQTISGETALHEWFTKIFAAQPLTPQPTAIIATQTSAAVEIENNLPDGTKRNTANFFHLNPNGQIQKLHIYRRT